MKRMMHFIRFWLLKMAFPVMALASKLGKPEPRVTADFYYYLWDVLEPGDVLLSKEDWKMTNVLVPGFWTHAAIYVGETKDFKETVVEAVGAGVCDVALSQWILTKDHVCVLRFKDLAPEQRATAAKKAFEHVGEPYDFDFSPGNKAWYCAEIVWYAFASTLGDAFNFTLKKTFGVETVTPEDFFLADKSLDKIAQCNGPE